MVNAAPASVLVSAPSGQLHNVLKPLGKPQVVLRRSPALRP